jgi:hypothetical protein
VLTLNITVGLEPLFPPASIYLPVASHEPSGQREGCHCPLPVDDSCSQRFAVLVDELHAVLVNNPDENFSRVAETTLDLCQATLCEDGSGNITPLHTAESPKVAMNTLR